MGWATLKLVGLSHRANLLPQFAGDDKQLVDLLEMHFALLALRLQLVLQFNDALIQLGRTLLSKGCTSPVLLPLCYRKMGLFSKKATKLLYNSTQPFALLRFFPPTHLLKCGSTIRLIRVNTPLKGDAFAPLQLQVHGLVMLMLGQLIFQHRLLLVYLLQKAHQRIDL